jgi:2-polyprenyl-3-methyl-5-hydroxy-6-metoxy-1,4-benzoquinol methylase
MYVSRLAERVKGDGLRTTTSIARFRGGRAHVTGVAQHRASIASAMRWDATSDDWERLGRLDPYWAVISQDAYRGANLSDAALAQFLQSGEDHVEQIWRGCREAFGGAFAPERALDFGCGVGRVAVPLARRVAHVVAVDVAASMLEHARRLAVRHHLANVEFVQSDDHLASIRGPFDLVHSTIVFQHIPVRRGLRLFRRLVELTAEGGVAVLHVLYDNPRRRAAPIRFAARLMRPLRGLRGRPPDIQMNAYPLTAVFKLLHAAGIRRFTVELTDHAGHLGATFLFRKVDTPVGDSQRPVAESAS